MSDTTSTLNRPMNKTEAIHLAVKELGYRAPVEDILAYIRQKFGIGVSIEEKPVEEKPVEETPVEETPVTQPASQQPITKRGKKQ